MTILDSNFASLISSHSRFAELVEDDLKSFSSPSEEILVNPLLWRYHLLLLKRKTETQFTSSKTRSFSLHRSFSSGSISFSQYHNLILKEKEWRINANKFLESIESRLGYIKTLL